MPKYKVYWVERYVSEVEADSIQDAEKIANYDNATYIGAETENVEEVKNAEVQSDYGVRHSLRVRG